MQNRKILVPGTIMRHFKGNLYQIISVALHSETLEEYVVYQALYGEYKTFIRPLEMFLSEVDHIKYPDSTQQYRFEVFDTKQTQDTVKQNENSMKQTRESFKQEGISTQDDLLTFLDADTYKEKLEILDSCKQRISSQMISSIALSMDLVLSSENLEDQINELRNCILMHMKFEDSRLR